MTVARAAVGPSPFVRLSKLGKALALGAALLVAPSLAGGASALAGPKDFVVYAPGMGGSPEQAKPYLDTFLRFLEQQLAWPAGSSGAEFSDDPKVVAQFLADKNPGFGLVSPALYFELSCKKTPMTLVAGVVGISDVAGSGKYYLVVKSGGPKTLEELKGKRLSSNHLQDIHFVSRVIFEDKIDVEKHFQLMPTNSPIKPFKAVDRGEADVALVNDAQLAHMKTLPAGQNLVVLFTSQALPPFPVVSFDKTVKPADRDALKKALLSMCSSKGGAEVCKSIQIGKFDPIDPKLYKAGSDLYCKP